jgi:hypothetical protein
MRQRVLIAALLVAASVALFGAYQWGRAGGQRMVIQPDPAASSAQAVDPNPQLAEAIAKIDRRLAMLEFRQLSAKPPEPPPAALAGAPAVASSTPFDPAALRENELARASAIEATLKTEARDGAWAAATESQIRTGADAAVKEGAQFSIKTVRCFTTVCEMVLAATSADQLRHTTFQLIPRISGMGSFDIALPETAADGSATLTYRLFRNGYPRPDEGT